MSYGDPGTDAGNAATAGEEEEEEEESPDDLWPEQQRDVTNIWFSVELKGSTCVLSGFEMFLHFKHQIWNLF